MHYTLLLFRISALLACYSIHSIPGIAAGASALPPRNPFLADSSNAIGHGTSAQQDSFATAGPSGRSHRLSSDEIDYVHLGPLHFGANYSGPYPGGRRVLWSNGADRVVKVDHDRFEVIANHPLANVTPYTPDGADHSIQELNEREGLSALYYAYQMTSIFDDLSGVYTLLDRDHQYYIGDSRGTIAVYGDAVPGNPDSAIETKRRWSLPPAVTGLMIGMNMTFDGWLIVATEHGYVVAVSRDFSQQHWIRLRHSEGAEGAATGPTGKGWVRNGFAIDLAGGIYIASQDHMHKLIWTGERLSIDPTDGAWTARYRNSGGEGTGASPSLMGFEDEDRFVVITDGDELMNLTLFWRDAIPATWQQLEGAPSRRIAGFLPANMGDPSRAEVQSEQSVVVAGYGALVVSNQPTNPPWWMPRRARMLLVSFLGSSPEYQPRGAQKFQWNPADQKLEVAWVNREVSSPNCVPTVSLGSGLAYVAGARNDEWTLEALDWQTGESRFHYVVGDQRYNSLFAGVLIDEAGRVMWGTIFGRVRLDPRDSP